MKRFFILLFFVLSWVLLQVSMANTENNVMPIEIANPDKILVEWMKTTFYIIINNKDVQENVRQFKINFYGNYSTKKRIIVPYDGENVVKVPFTIPLLAYPSNISLDVIWLYKDKRVHKQLSLYFSLEKNFKVYKKYPSSILPSLIADKYNSEVKKWNYKYYKSNWFGVSVDPIGGSPLSNYYFSWRWGYEKLKDYKKEVSNIKKYVKDEIGQSPYERGHDINKKQIKFTYNIVNQQISSSDPNIESINYAIWCNREEYGATNIHYECNSKIIAKVKTSPYIETYKNYVRYFSFYSDFHDEWSPDKAQKDRSKYMSELENFAKNIVLVNPQNMTYKESTPVFSKSYDLKSKLKNVTYNYKGLVHSENYNKIMNGDKPKIKKHKKGTNVANRQFKLKLSPWLKDSIRNTGILNAPIDYASVWIMVNISGKAFDKDNKEIKDVKDNDLFADSTMVCSMVSKNSQLWFKNGSEIVKTELNKITESHWTCDIISKWPHFYKWPYKNLEYVDVYIIDKNKKIISNVIRYKIKVIDATPNIELDKQGQSIQDTADSVFKFKINDKYHKNFKCKVSFPYDAYIKNHMPTIKISNQGKGKWGYITEFDCQEGKEIPIRVSPPKLGNFNVLWELNSLSMVDLQKDTAISLAWDLVWYGVEERLKNLAQTKKNLSFIHGKKMVQGSKILWRINNYEKTIRTLNRADDIAGKTQDAIKVAQTKQNIDSLVKDTKEMNSDVQKKSATEKIADAWIWWINVLQSTVWCIAMAPDYIPILWKTKLAHIAGKITGKFTLAFDLMTNVWKWDLQYISKSEKIDRAQDKKMPYPIVIEVTAKDWLQTKDVQTINVLFTWLDK